jgi:cephalosporin-C deacetylase
MPILDMPLEKLKQYGGVNPRPKDFDAYWDRALKDLQAVDPQVEFVPASFQCSFAECFDLFFTGVGGARIHAKYLRPRNASSPSPALLQFHGYTQNAGSWSSKLQYVAAGFCVAAMD